MNHYTTIKRTLAVTIATALALVLGAVTLPTAYAQNTKPLPVTKSLPVKAKAARSTTVLIYLNGSDLESDAGEATADMAEMLASGVGENTNVVIETLGTREWHNYNIASDHTQRYLVKNGKLELVDDSLPQLDTTAPQTLSDFIAWGTTNYPADRYVLVMWDHGGGPVYGFGYDEFQDEGAALTLDEMQQALAANPNVHFDIIGMDCCIMGSLETCVALQPYCDYMVLSEDFVPGTGWSYQGWMSELERNPTVSSEDLGKMIVDDMISDTVKDPENGEATLALIDESSVDELYNAWLNFAYENKDSLLANNYSQQTEWRDRPQHATSNKPHGTNGYETNDQYGDPWHSMDENTWNEYGDWGEYGGLEDWTSLWENWGYDGSNVTLTDYNVTDMMSVATSVDSEASNNLQAAFNDAIVHFGSTSGEEGMSGLAVALPYGDAEFYEQLVKVFSACGIDNDYLNWLESFVDVTDTSDYYNPDEGYGFEYEYENEYGNEFGNGCDPQSTSGFEYTIAA
ncbi:MAG: hypothetical protein IKG22_00640 [Atopobiaceae bacterium]|nr:hypothetical protein [Atopobiaceae bacterium]